MATLVELAEAHLMNVQREIATLEERKAGIDAEVAKLTAYLEEGRATLKSAAADAPVQKQPQVAY